MPVPVVPHLVPGVSSSVPPCVQLSTGTRHSLVQAIKSGVKVFTVQALLECRTAAEGCSTVFHKFGTHSVPNFRFLYFLGGLLESFPV